MFNRFDIIHERDRRTDGLTPYDGIGLTVRSVAPQKWKPPSFRTYIA